MKMPDAPPELIDRFAVVMDRFPEAERRKMFGYPAAFVNGNLATGLFGDGWMARLPPEDVARLLADGSASQFAPMPGRPMKGYVLLPREAIADDAAIGDWVARSIAYAATIPPKR